MTLSRLVLIQKVAPTQLQRLRPANNSTSRTLSVSRALAHSNFVGESGENLETYSRSAHAKWHEGPESRRCSSVDTNHSAAPRSMPRCQRPSASVRWSYSPSGGSRSIFTTALLHSAPLPKPHISLSSASSRAFSSSAAAMAAERIDGTAIAKKVREQLKADIAEKKGINPRFQPCLKIIQGMFTFQALLHPAGISQYCD